MIKTIDKSLCCGCSACVQKCPKQCISLYTDNEGFLYPSIETNICIDCGLCEKVCHELHPYQSRQPLKVLAAINKNEEIRMASSSGGIFSLLAQKTISEGGVVFGAKFDEQWQIVIDYAETMNDVRSFYESKYVQARTNTSYSDAEFFLKSGRKVLFSGTPCQIAGLHHYLCKPYDNLTTVDFVCHGVPSPKVWDMYLHEVINAWQHIDDFKFRTKHNGWHRFNFSFAFSDEGEINTIHSFHGKNHFMRAFLNNIILRPSCHNCKAKNGRSYSDITIADFWGVEYEHPEMDDDKGTGLVLINSDKGITALDWSRIRYTKSTLAQALKYNTGINDNAIPHPKRDEFFQKLNKTHSVISLIDTLLHPNIKQRIKQQIISIQTFVINYFSMTKKDFISIEHKNPKFKKQLSHISFRNKVNGWKNYCVELKFRTK